MHHAKLTLSPPSIESWTTISFVISPAICCHFLWRTKELKIQWNHHRWLAQPLFKTKLIIIFQVQRAVASILTYSNSRNNHIELVMKFAFWRLELTKIVFEIVRKNSFVGTKHTLDEKVYFSTWTASCTIWSYILLPVCLWDRCESKTGLKNADYMFWESSVRIDFKPVFNVKTEFLLHTKTLLCTFFYQN